VDLLRELIQISIGKIDRFSSVPTPEEWESLYAEARKQAILGVTYMALESIPPKQLSNPAVASKWKDKKEKIAIMGEVYEDHCRRISGILSRLGYRSCILKGQGLSSRFYPEPFLRQCGDIDVWVDGSRKEIVCNLRRKYEVHHIYYHECKVGFFPHLTTEVHFIPIRMFNPMNSCRLKRFFKESMDEAMTAELPGKGYCTPEAPFNAVYLMGHILRHALKRGVGLRHIWDYYYVLGTMTPSQKEEARKQLRRLGLEGICSEVMYVLNYLFGVEKDELLFPPAEKRGRQLLSEILRDGNFGIISGGSDKKRGRKGEFKYALRFPSEVFWIPLSRVWHFFWRKFFNFSL